MDNVRILHPKRKNGPVATENLTERVVGGVTLVEYTNRAGKTRSFRVFDTGEGPFIWVNRPLGEASVARLARSSGSATSSATSENSETPTEAADVATV